ncbi:MAG: response regulator [Clostridiales bacterium]|nr:response regulator [Clostridiales bacterium]
MYKLLIIDDEPLVQAGIRSMLAWEELGINVCGIAPNGQVGWEIMEKEQPDIIITDVKMPVMSGLELLKKTRELYPHKDYPAFIILTSYEEFQMAKEALTYHAADYLIKIELTPETLKNSVLRAIDSISASAALSKQETELSSADLQMLREKFFIHLLHNLYDSPEQFKLLMHDLEIPFSYAAYQCCYFEMSNPSVDAMNIQKQIVLYTNSYQLLQKIAGKYLAKQQINAYFVTLDRNHGAIILLYSEIPDTSNDTQIISYLEQICASLTGYYQTSMKIGIGTIVSEPLSIADSYQSARAAFGSITEPSGIATASSIQPDSYMIFNLSLVKNDLSRAFSEYDETLLSSVLEQVIALFEEHPTHYVQALDAACNLLFLSISLMPNGETLLSSLFSDYSDGYRSIYRQNTTEQVINWLGQFRDRLCQSFIEHKKEHRHHIVDNVKKYIEIHVTQKLNLNDVATIYGISPNYLSSLFKKYNNCGYSEYVTERKIAEAKRMMQKGNVKIYEVADALGFENAFYFSKVFKKVEGISPTEYLNRADSPS